MNIETAPKAGLARGSSVVVSTSKLGSTERAENIDNKMPGGSLEGKLVVQRRHVDWLENQIRWRWLMDSATKAATATATPSTVPTAAGLPCRNLFRHKREYPDPQQFPQVYQGFAGFVGAVGVNARPRRRQRPVSRAMLGADRGRDGDGRRLRAAAGPDARARVRRRGRRDPSGEGVTTRRSPATGRPTCSPGGKTSTAAARRSTTTCARRSRRCCSSSAASTSASTIPRRRRARRSRPAPTSCGSGSTRSSPRYILPHEHGLVAHRHRRADTSNASSASTSTRPIGWITTRTATRSTPKIPARPATTWRRDYVRWRLWRSDESILYNFDGSEVLDRVPHNFGRVPIVRLIDLKKHRTRNVGKSRYEAIAEYQREYYNRDSELILSDTLQAHPFLSGPEDFCKADNTLSIGPGYLLPKKKNPENGSLRGLRLRQPAQGPGRIAAAGTRKT